MAVPTIRTLASDSVEPAKEQSTILRAPAVVALRASAAAAPALLAAAPTAPAPQARLPLRCPRRGHLRRPLTPLVAATAAALARLELLKEGTALLRAAALILVLGLVDISLLRHGIGKSTKQRK